MFLNDRNTIDDLRLRRDADMFWIAITAVAAFVAMFSGLLSSVFA